MCEVESEVVFHVVEEGGWFVASAVGHAIFTQGVDLAELRLMVVDAVICHFDEGDCPSVIRLRFGDLEELVRV